MRKGIVLILALMLAGGILAPAYAQEAPPEPIDVPSLNLPDMQAGLVYSAKDGKFNSCATLTALSYPTKIAEIELRGGFAFDVTDLDAKKPIASLCVKIGDLSSLGIHQPLHNLINVSAGVYAGYDFDLQETDYGLTATILQLKF